MLFLILYLSAHTVCDSTMCFNNSPNITDDVSTDTVPITNTVPANAAPIKC